MEIHECCNACKIDINPVWVSRKDNVEADRLGLSLREAVTAELHKAGAVTEGMERLGENMVTHLLRSRSSNTNSKYFGAFRRWEKFITEEGACALPGAPIHVALYLTKLIDKSCSFNSVQAAFYGIKWAHKVCNFDDPTNTSFVISSLESAKRQNSLPLVKKDIITSDQIIALCEKYESSTDVLVLRDLVMIVLSFAGFLRFEEVWKEMFSHIQEQAY
ncbi:uncharacterized protein LOC117343458 [Pecten maximus]|uniref:uncharacterized protein LOC117343458 n=1 Tax=Pecten maximus TaxID=6579 RepID=UPI001458F4D1|nr:uncharacterized protein LOC117343458 [Pecten maximus]